MENQRKELSLRERWDIAQSKERSQEQPITYEEGLQHYMQAYEKYFSYVGRHPDLDGKSVLEIGCSNYAAIPFCDRYGKSYVLDPLDSESLRRQIKDKNIEFINEPAEEVDFPKVDEVWLFNVLQHTMDPDLIIKKSKEAAKVVRFFEPIECPTDECHLHKFDLAYFARHFGTRTTFYPPNPGEHGFHTHQCAYGACDVEHVLLPGDVVEKREMAGNVIKGVLDFTIDENKISWHIDDGGDDSLIVRDFDALKKSV